MYIIRIVISFAGLYSVRYLCDLGNEMYRAKIEERIIDQNRFND